MGGSQSCSEVGLSAPSPMSPLSEDIVSPPSSCEHVCVMRVNAVPVEPRAYFGFILQVYDS